MTAQIIKCTFDEYFEIEAFSSSRAKTLISSSPLHAKSEIEKSPTAAMDRGQVIGRLVLGKGAEFDVLKYKDWRTNDAKADRDKSRKAGKVPILEEAFGDACMAAESIRVGLADLGINLDGQSELAVTWIEKTPDGDVPCKAMFDHVWIDRGVIIDLKTTENASPGSVERTAENLGYAIQYAAYTRALTALDPKRYAGRTDFLFAFGETKEPYALNVCRPDGAFAELGERRWLRAVATWAHCMKNNRWPAYGTGVNNLTAPQWALAREEYVEL